jgi:hypothetical protein
MTKQVLESAKGLNVTRTQASIDALGKKSWDQQIDLCKKLAAVADEAKEKKVKVSEWGPAVKMPEKWYDPKGSKHYFKLLRIGKASQNDMSQYMGTLKEGESPSILSCYSALGALAKGKTPDERKKKESKVLCAVAITKNLAEKLGIQSGSVKWDSEGLNSNLSTAEVHKFIRAFAAASGLKI